MRLRIVEMASKGWKHSTKRADTASSMVSMVSLKVVSTDLLVEYWQDAQLMW
jgi:hypothetical protein